MTHQGSSLSLSFRFILLKTSYESWFLEAHVGSIHGRENGLLTLWQTHYNIGRKVLKEFLETRHLQTLIVCEGINKPSNQHHKHLQIVKVDCSSSLGTDASGRVQKP